MRSLRVTPNTVAAPNDYNALVNDSAGAASLLVHQMYGTIALPTNPTNGQTLTLDINGTNVVITFVSVIGSTAGNVLIAGTAPLTLANAYSLLLNPTISNSTQVAIGVNTAANVTLVNYINWSLSGTNIVASSYNSILYAPATSFSATTTVTGGSYTAATMKLYVEPGVFYIAGTRVIFAGGSTPAVTAPVSHPRIDVLSINASGTLSWTTGTENTSPVAPTYPSPASNLVLCELYNVTGETQLLDNANQSATQGYISNDVRPFQQPAMTWGAFSSNLIPDADGTRNLGSASFEWNNLYVKSGIFLNGNSFGSQITLGLNALESISAGAPISIGVTQSSDIVYDTSGRTTATGSVTIGSNSNRVIVVIATGHANFGGSCTISGTFGGAALTFTNATKTDGSGNPYSIATAILVAPSTGSQAFALTAAGTGAGIDAVYYFSLYNCAQSSPQDGVGTSGGTSTGTSASLSLTTDGSIVVGVVTTSNTGSSTLGTVSGTAFAANTSTGNSPAYGLGDSGPTNIFPAGTSISISNSGGTSQMWLGAVVAVKSFTAATEGFINASSASITVGNTRCTGFAGFALTTVATGQPLTGVVQGVVTALTGLILGTQYHLNDTNGTIGTSAGSNTRKVGIAVSATSLLITNIW